MGNNLLIVCLLSARIPASIRDFSRGKIDSIYNLSHLSEKYHIGFTFRAGYCKMKAIGKKKVKNRRRNGG
jgi:hypothetical protein